ncbi:MAG: HAD-like domain-containing protein [Benjaminiella poitrasii]|nr:MAG: HAD-like domain-containing protein [Benjaminiella poitrasii]
MPLILIDFDETITQRDTIAPLGQFALSAAHSSTPWSFFTDAYLQDYYSHRDYLKTHEKQPPQNLKALIDQLDSYRHVEFASLQRIGEHHVFQGLCRDDLVKAGREMSHTELQPGVVETLLSQEYYQPQIRIISLNWSKDWIMGFLGHHLPTLTKEQIFSNDLKFDEQQGICTGEIEARILTAKDKQQVIQALKKEQKTFYVGDSLGDVEALVEADVGIIMGRNKALLEALAQYNYIPQENTSQSSGLYRVDRWNQVKHILDRHYLE